MVYFTTQDPVPCLQATELWKLKGSEPVPSEWQKMENQPGRADPTVGVDSLHRWLPRRPRMLPPPLQSALFFPRWFTSWSSKAPQTHTANSKAALCHCSGLPLPGPHPSFPPWGHMCWICPLRDYSRAVFTPGEKCPSITKFKYLFSHLKTFNLLWQQLHQLF